MVHLLKLLHKFQLLIIPFFLIKNFSCEICCVSFLNHSFLEFSKKNIFSQLGKFKDMGVFFEDVQKRRELAGSKIPITTSTQILY